MARFTLRHASVDVERLDGDMTIHTQHGTIGGSRGDWMIRHAFDDIEFVDDYHFRQRFSPVDEAAHAMWDADLDAE